MRPWTPENSIRKITSGRFVYFSESPSDSDSVGLVSMMCMEELKLTFKVRPIATVRRAVSFKLFKDPSEVRAK